MNDGPADCQEARIALKSESADTTIRPSSRARARISSSLAACIPYALTWTASWPAAQSNSATCGDSALSIRNFKRNVAVAIPLHRRGCGEAQALTNIFGLEIRILG